MNRVRSQGRDDDHDILDESCGPSHEPLALAPDLMDLERALARLSPTLRTVLLLVSAEEYTYAEAAEILQIPIGTVMSRLHRAREAVRLSMSGAADAGAPAPLHLVKR